MAVAAAPCRPMGTSVRITRGSRPNSGGKRSSTAITRRRRSARQRIPVAAETEPLELTSRGSDRPSAVRPALALTAAEEVETIRRVLLEAATNTTRESWATCSCPECGKSFRQEISVPDHGARIKAVETLLREGLGRVGEAEVAEPRMPASAAEVEALSWSEMKFIFAISYVQAIQAFVDRAKPHCDRNSSGGSPRPARRWHEHSQKSPEKSLDPDPEDHELRRLTGATPITQISRPRCDVVLRHWWAQSGSSFGSNTTQWGSLSMDSSTERMSRRTLMYFHSGVRAAVRVRSQTERGSRRSHSIRLKNRADLTAV